MSSFLENLKYTLEESNLSFEIDLLSWNTRFDVGYDKNDESVELVWCYIDFGCFSLKIAVVHWGGI